MINKTEITTLIAVFYLSLLIGYKTLLNCDVQRLLTTNQYMNHFVTFFCCFFLVSIFYQKNESVAKLWGVSIIGYLLVMMLLKTRLEIVGVVFVLLMIDQSINTSIFSKQQQNPDDPMIDQLQKIRNYIFYGVIIMIMVGFLLYFIKQRKEHPENFSYLTFFFGKSDCTMFYEKNVY